MEDLSGNSVFWRERDAEIYLTYQLFGRGGEDSMGIYRLFDMLPLGREERRPKPQPDGLGKATKPVRR